MIYGNRLKNIRDEREIKQKDIALIIGIDNTLYCHYENEDDVIPLKHLIKLCEYFNVSLDYVFEFSNIKNYDNNHSFIDNNVSGARLKEFRKENKITQQKLANVLNTTKSVICGYEKGRYLIATAFLYTICKKYNISADYLLGKVDKPKYLNNL